jgi:hypothetical protein
LLHKHSHFEQARNCDHLHRISNLQARAATTA